MPERIEDQIDKTQGRPTLYEPGFCEEVVASAKLGISLTGFAGKIGVRYCTIKAWVRERPDFAAAVAVAKAARCYGLEADAITIRRKGGSPGQASMAQFKMKNLDGAEYADRQAVEHSGRDDGPIKREPAVFNFTFIPRTHRVTPEGQIVPRGPSPLLAFEANAEPIEEKPSHD